jgi:arginase
MTLRHQAEPRSPPLRLFFPEWQGYAAHDGSRRGAQLIREQVCGPWEFTHVEVAPDATLVTERGIVGRAAVVQNTKSCLEVLRRHEPRRIFTLGGTCAVELGPVSHLNRLYPGEMAVVWLDAHGDLNTPSTSPSGHFHGMVLRTLLGEGDSELVSLCGSSITPSQVFLVGLRDRDPGEEEYIVSSGVEVLDAGTTADQLARRIEGAGFRRVYVHLDLDVLDPRDFDEVIYPVPEGVRFDRLLEMLHALTERMTVVGSSLLEFVPGTAPQLDKLGKLVRPLGR